MEVRAAFGPKSDDFAPQASPGSDVRHQSLPSIFSCFFVTLSKRTFKHSKPPLRPLPLLSYCWLPPIVKKSLIFRDGIPS